MNDLQLRLVTEGCANLAIGTDAARISSSSWSIPSKYAPERKPDPQTLTRLRASSHGFSITEFAALLRLDTAFEIAPLPRLWHSSPGSP